jgi:hypothetical protein
MRALPEDAYKNAPLHAMTEAGTGRMDILPVDVELQKGRRTSTVRGGRCLQILWCVLYD